MAHQEKYDYNDYLSHLNVYFLIVILIWFLGSITQTGSLFFFSPLFNQVGKLRTSSHLQLRPGQDKAKQFDTYNDTELHME
jgi:hypothetical protein